MPISSTPDPGRVEETGELMCRARRILAYGGLDGVVYRPLRHGEQGVFPHFAVEARGCELVDSTGQVFVDWVNGWGPVILGYRHPAVEEAIRAQLAAGPTLSLMHPIEVEVAEALVEMVPCAEMVAFGKNGSDALTAAVRVARAVTGREMVLQCGMHGFHDWYICTHPQVCGIPAVLREHIASFPYNDLTALEEALERWSGRVAAVIMEPVREVLPESGYLEGVRELTRRHGALLVFDEVVTALRLGPGGAQEALGVVPDIACLGKSLANGMPLSAIVGRREYMQRLPSVGFGMTFRGETLSLAAARAVLDVVRREPVAEHLARVGEAVRTAFRADCRQIGVDWDLTGPPARMSFLFAGGGGLSAESLRDLFLQECLKRGVFTNGNLLPSYAHDDDAIQRTGEALRDALAVAAEAIREGRLRELHTVGGFPHGPRAHGAQGFLDEVRELEDGLHLRGWMLLGDGAPDGVEVEYADGCSACATSEKRPELARAFPLVPMAEDGGYAVRLPLAAFPPERDCSFEILAFRGERVAFRCRVLRRRRPAGSNPEEGPYWTGDGILYI